MTTRKRATPETRDERTARLTAEFAARDAADEAALRAWGQQLDCTNLPLLRYLRDLEQRVARLESDMAGLRVEE